MVLLHSLQTSSSRKSTANGDADLTSAIKDGDVKYLLVEQPIDSKNILETTKVSEFTIYE